MATHRTGLGPCSVMRLNPWNAVLGLGHTGGVVSVPFLASLFSFSIRARLRVIIISCAGAWNAVLGLGHTGGAVSGHTGCGDLKL